MAKDITELELQISANTAELKRGLSDVQTELGGIEKKAKGATSGLSSGFKGALPEISKFTAGMAAAGLVMEGFRIGIEGMIAKETKLAEFSAITGMVGKDLEKFGDAATELSNQFGTSTIDNIEAFKGVLSRLGPDFASSTEAVKLMGENINTLALASGMDATESMDALTTAMLQFGVDLSDPLKAAREAADMMNIMAAGAKEGAVEIPELNAALEVTGAAAKGAGMRFAELNAALQLSKKAGLEGAAAGTAMRNMLTRLQAPTKEVSDLTAKYGIDMKEVAKSISGPKGLTGTMQMLKVKFDAIKEPSERNALLNKIYGETSESLGRALMNNVAEFEKLEGALEGTTTAQEQAATMLDTTENKFKRLSAFVENTLVGAMEAGRDALGEVFGFFESIANLDFEKTFQSAVNGIRSFVEYSTLGLSETALEFVGLGKDAEEAGGKLVDTGKNIELNAANAWQTQLGLAGAINKTNEAAKKLDKTTDKTDKKTGKAKKALKAEFKDREIDIDLLHRRNKEMERTQELLTAMREGLFGPLPGASDMAKNLNVMSNAFVGTDGLLNNLDLSVSTFDKFALAADQAGIGVETVGNLFATAFSGSDDALKAVLKSILSNLITVVEGAILAGSAYSSVSAIFSAGLSAFKDAPLLSAAIVALEAARGMVNSFAVGTNYVSHDQLAMIHKGEAVIPASQAERMRQGQAMSLGKGRKQDIRIHVSEFASAIEDQHMRVSRRTR